METIWSKLPKSVKIGNATINHMNTVYIGIGVIALAGTVQAIVWLTNPSNAAAPKNNAVTTKQTDLPPGMEIATPPVASPVAPPVAPSKPIAKGAKPDLGYANMPPNSFLTGESQGYSGVNVRSSASLLSKTNIVGVYPNGTRIEVLSEIPDFYEVFVINAADNKRVARGWVAASMVTNGK